MASARSPGSPDRLSWLAHARALFVTFHLVAISLLALPAPEGAMNREHWRDPTVQAELAAWATVLGVEPDRLEEHLWRLALGYEDWRDRVLAPFALYYDWCHTVQSWRMFVAPHRHPTRLQIALHERGQWRTLFVERDRAHAWRARQLGSYRFRSVIFRLGWSSYETDRHHFADWVARQAALDFPDADRVRVELVRFRTLSPQEVRAGRPREARSEYVLERPVEGRR